VFYSYWTFTDIFEEGGQLSEPWSNSFGIQTIHQVAATARPLVIMRPIMSQILSSGSKASLQGASNPEQTR
jgi:hypothetical protein